MYYLITFTLNIVLGMYLTRIEISKFSTENQKTTLMGGWPFSLVLLLGLLLNLLGESMQYEFESLIFIIIGTGIFYFIEINKILKDIKLNKS
ncbi:hypothetical protein [Pseudoalteromonas denitrificans]|uniref:Uncharacterized protein n=1 Tax=Pseudoalteromonas denitrificans DSM 6059 TaxID=1123010 RepID=A0A1I1UYJ1_9GAMM|nr:hypothetical protein [Pseudoalteromonas denitrificans]SFD75892.1 hypothetical protein SAMN02745724_05375 [Pseudoalteromonas denitrificans DSM 6059]